MLALVIFQATINLLIGYEPPPNATTSVNDQPDGDTSYVDAGKSWKYLMEEQMVCMKITSLSSQEAAMTPMKGRPLWTEGAKVEVCLLPLQQIRLGNPTESQADSAVRGTEPWPTNLRTSRYCLCSVLCFSAFLNNQIFFFMSHSRFHQPSNTKNPKHQHSCSELEAWYLKNVDC